MYLGPAVDPATRELRYSSVSAIAKFDPREEGGCPRRWFMRYVLRMAEPPQPHQELGIRVHAQIEHYLKSGEDVLGPVARPGKPLLPAPGADLRVEWGFNDKPKPPGDKAFFEPKESLLTADGLPLIGYMDWINPRGEYVSGEGTLCADPPGSAEVGDNKTSSSVKWAKENDALIQTPQMAGYAEWMRLRHPSLCFVRVSHVVMQTKPLTQAEERQGEKAAVKRTALIPVEIVRNRWYESGHLVVKQMREVARAGGPDEVPMNEAACTAYKGCPFRRNCYTNPLRRLEVSLLAKARAQTGSSPSIPTPAPSVPTPQPAAATATASATASGVIAEGPTVLAYKAEKGKTYKLADGQVVRFLCEDKGEFIFIPTAGGIPVMVAPDGKVTEVLEAAKSNGANGAAKPNGTKPLETPIEPPKVTQPTAAAQPETLAVEKAIEAKAEAKPESQGETEPKKRGRPRKSDATGTNAAAEPDGLQIYVNCLPNGPFESLDPYIWEKTQALEKQFGVIDIRCAPDANNPLSYARWKGALAALVRNEPPRGNFVVMTRGSEVAQVVAEALGPICSTGAYVRGI